MKRKLFLLLTVVLCLFGTAVATDVETGILPTEEIYLTLEKSDFAVFARGEFTGEEYREQLDGDYLTIYDAINSSALGSEQETDLTAVVPLGFSQKWDATFVRDSGGNVSVDAETMAKVDEYCQEKVALILPALSGLLQDEVCLSWLTNQTFSVGTPLSYSVLWSGSVGVGTLHLNDITFRLKDDSITAAAETGTLSDFQSGIADAVAVLEEEYHIDDAANRYETVSILQEYVCDTVEYADGDLTPRKYQTVYSALVDGVSVCAGYSKLYKALCDEYEIPCILVQGESFDVGHMWNYVRMEDGAWYAVDTTWDDLGRSADTTYFLCGEDVLFSEHVALTNWGYGYPYVYPALSETGYQPSTVELSTVNGAQIRTKGAMGLRFISSMKKNEAVVEYGMVLIPTADLTDVSELKIGAELCGHTVAKVEAKYLYAEDEDSVTFTAVITNIKPQNYTREYTARAYAILDSGDVVYGESFTSRSVAAVASAALERDPNLSDADRELFESIVGQ
ncbi:MAG: hypothetical protein IJC88_04790 [Oscillospiraceae bacterium]|nr:hypothetical protein [Oscillospiraceae bacterium]